MVPFVNAAERKKKKKKEKERREERGWKARGIRGRASLALYLMRPDAIDSPKSVPRRAHGSCTFAHTRSWIPRTPRAHVSRRWNVGHCTSCICLAFKRLPDAFFQKFSLSDYVSRKILRRQMIFISI